jgi:hypothetical protein
VFIGPHLTPAMAARGGLSGSVPTPHGPVRVVISVTEPEEQRAQAGSSIEVSLPTGCTGGARLELSAVLLVRLGWLQQLGGTSESQAPLSLLVNGSRVTAVFAGLRGPLYDEAHPERGRSGVWAINLPPGAHAIKASDVLPERALKAVPSAGEDPFPPAMWPARFIGVDTETRGDWIGRFGASGYVLFGFNASGTVETLPSFLASVRPIEGSLANWLMPPPANDSRALQNPNGGPRGIGCALAALVWPGMTVGVDVLMTSAAEGQWYQVGVGMSGGGANASNSCCVVCLPSCCPRLPAPLSRSLPMSSTTILESHRTRGSPLGRAL